MRKMILGVMIMGLWSCTKQVVCEGILYSRHNVPVPDEDVYFNVYGSASSYPTGGSVCKTDQNGRFYFSMKVRKKYPMELECRSDSGYVRKSLGTPKEGTEFHIALMLHDW